MTTSPTRLPSARDYAGDLARSVTALGPLRWTDVCSDLQRAGQVALEEGAVSDDELREALEPIARLLLDATDE